MQEGDILLFQTVDEGEINVENGLIQMSRGLETAAYLALFGGNEDDPGGSDTTLSWWGNVDETDPAEQYRSETQNLIDGLPATASNLRRIEDASNRDLAFFVDKGIASEVVAVATIPGLNKLKIAIAIDQQQFDFIINWAVRP